MKLKGILCGLAAAIAVAAGAQAASAQNAQSSQSGQSAPFAGAQITIHVGTSAGSTYDTYARLVADHMGRFIPGSPGIIVQNQAGAGGAVATSYLYNVAPKDGTALGFVQQNLPLFQVLSPDKAKFDMAKMNWIGTLTDIGSVVAMWHATGAKTVADVQKAEFAVGTTGRGSETYQVPTIMNALLDTKFRLVAGYKGVAGMDVAIEQGELHGRGGSLLSWTSRKQDWIRDGKVNFIVQIGLERAKEIPDVPLLIELAKDDRTRKIFELMSSAGAVGRSMVAPPGMPAERVAILKTAFEEMVRDPAFLADAEKRALPINAGSGDKVQTVVANTVAAPKEIVDELRTLLGM
ncbi:MAG: tripartite tricarboxylate transporter substrate-binding protein [Rhodospirillaceae bacterium]